MTVLTLTPISILPRVKRSGSRLDDARPDGQVARTRLGVATHTDDARDRRVTVPLAATILSEPAYGPGTSSAIGVLGRSSASVGQRPRRRVDQSRVLRYWWMSATAIAPSPTAEATRLMEP